jgi:hypothetical protein
VWTWVSSSDGTNSRIDTPTAGIDRIPLRDDDRSCAFEHRHGATENRFFMALDVQFHNRRIGVLDGGMLVEGHHRDRRGGKPVVGPVLDDDCGVPGRCTGRKLFSQGQFDLAMVVGQRHADDLGHLPKIVQIDVRLEAMPIRWQWFERHHAAADAHGLAGQRYRPQTDVRADVDGDTPGRLKSRWVSGRLKSRWVSRISSSS